MKKLFAALIGLAMSASLLFAGGSNEVANEDVDTIKAGFVYVGPVGDYGWTYAHDQGRLFAEQELSWLETVYVESVAEGDAGRIIDRLIMQEGATVIFTTSFGYMDDTLAAAAKYPDVIFMHCSGFKQTENLGTYFGDLYQAYYLNGMMAGTLTNTNKLGYVAAFPIPELIRHINAFALGAKAVNPDVEVHVRWTYAWYGPDKAKEAANSLISIGVDSLAFTEDTPAVIEVGQEHTENGKQIYTFSHYSPMQQYGPDSVVSGQLSDWGIMYVEILNSIKNGTWANEDMWWLMKERATYLGGNYLSPVNPLFESALNKTGVLQDILSLYAIMITKGPEGFDPYEGPIYDNEGNLQVAEGTRANKGELLSIMYYVDGVIGSIPE